MSELDIITLTLAGGMGLIIFTVLCKLLKERCGPTLIEILISFFFGTLLMGAIGSIYYSLFQKGFLDLSLDDLRIPIFLGGVAMLYLIIQFVVGQLGIEFALIDLKEKKKE